MNMERTTLGRGLGSLLGEAEVMENEREKIHLIPIERIHPNPRQPRQTLDTETLEELANSIREQGILQPVLLRPLADSNDLYELVAGERRWRAAKLADMETIPALVRPLDDDQALEVAILENVQREDLNPVETARGYDMLIKEFDYSHKKVGRRVGKSRMAVTNLLRLLRLPEPVLAWIVSGKLSTGHARALLGLEESPKRLIQLAEEVAIQGLSVRETESLVRKERGEEEVTNKPLNKPPAKGHYRDPTIIQIENRLISALSTKVTITHKKGKGKLILEYTSPENLESLANRLLKELQN